MEKNKVLVLAGTLAVSGAMLLHSDVVIAASTTGSATVANTAASNLQNGSYTATAKLYKTGTTNDSMMSSMVLPTANVVIKNGQAIITLQFKDLSTSDMVKSWIIDGVSAVKKDNNFNVVLPVSDLNKTLNSTIHVETMIGSKPFTETQPVDINVTDLKFVARDPEEVAAEQAAEKAAADRAAADKAAADKEAAEKAAADKEAADKAAADKAAADKAAADKAAADKAAADKAAADKAAADKAAADKAAADKAAQHQQNGSYTATAKLYKTGTTNDSMMSSMVLPTANVVIKNEQAIITLRFKDLNTSDMVKSWIIDGVSAVKKDNNFNVVLPVSDLNKTLNSTIHV
ncbi:NEAT domain-containing protein, partial [Leuconostoc mesenteroides]|uniref:NEAT domain-containing protein n=1 Tax=Leuconostoc mesenteroides TaxID=1245 RepID=UPI0006832020